MRPLNIALALCTALLAHAGAGAAELTLFSGTDMGGRQITVRGDVRNLNTLRFNDGAMSLAVGSGRWEACVDADFGGECRIFDVGQYRNLDRFARKISSLREIDAGGARDDRRDDRRGGRDNGRRMGQAVTLFEGRDMSGRSLVLRGDTPNLEQNGFNDLTRSMVIRSGSWEVCQHRDFGGKCQVFGPGEYDNLGRDFRRSISSIRQVGDGDGGRGRGRDRGDGDDHRGQRDGQDGRGEGVELFTAPGFGGERVPVNEEVRTLDRTRFNDRTGSIVVHSGEWQFCQHADFRGQCVSFGPGRYDRLGNMSNTISSVRRVR